MLPPCSFLKSRLHYTVQLSAFGECWIKQSKRILWLVLLIKKKYILQHGNHIVDKAFIVHKYCGKTFISCISVSPDKCKGDHQIQAIFSMFKPP